MRPASGGPGPRVPPRQAATGPGRSATGRAEAPARSGRKAAGVSHPSIPVARGAEGRSCLERRLGHLCLRLAPRQSCLGRRSRLPGLACPGALGPLRAAYLQGEHAATKRAPGGGWQPPLRAAGLQASAGGWPFVPSLFGSFLRRAPALPTPPAGAKNTGSSWTLPSPQRACLPAQEPPSTPSPCQVLLLMHPLQPRMLPTSAMYAFSLWM